MSLPNGTIEGPVLVVPGIDNHVHCVCYPPSSKMFKDVTRRNIVNLSLSANEDFVAASLLDKKQEHRKHLLEQAISKRIEEQALWKALDPPDLIGAWKADLAISAYHHQNDDMVSALDALMNIYENAPRESPVWQMCLLNLNTLMNQLQPFFPDAPRSNPPTTLQLMRVRQFLVHCKGLSGQ